MVTAMQAAMNASTRLAAAIADVFIKKENPLLSVGRVGIKRKLKLWIMNNKESSESTTSNRQVNG